MSEVLQTPIVEDESVLDAELDASIKAVQAGKKLEEQSPSETAESVTTESTGETPGDSQKIGITEEDTFRIPNKGKFESDEAYEKRVYLFDLVKRRKAAVTPEAKSALSSEISKAKGDLKTVNNLEKFVSSTTNETTTQEIDPDLQADKDRLKELGGTTKEDVAEIVRQERMTQEVESNLKTFVDRKSELKDEDVRDVFFDFVDTNYAWQNKSGKDLIAILEMAHEAMFRPSETMQDRVLKGAEVANKVNAMQFPGGTGNKFTYSPEMQKSIDELKATGMSEDKAIELLSE